jgi:hypothetical protein
MVVLKYTLARYVHSLQAGGDQSSLSCMLRLQLQGACLIAATTDHPLIVIKAFSMHGQNCYPDRNRLSSVLSMCGAVVQLKMCCRWNPP